MATQITLIGNNTLFGARHIVKTSAGKLYAVFEADGKVQVWYSADGSSWAQKDAGNSPDCMADSPVAVAIDSNDILHIVYYHDAYPASGGLDYITFDTSTDLFGAEEQAMNQQDADNLVYGCAIAIDSNDKPHAVFVDSDAAKGTDYDTIYYANKIGAGWTTPPIEVDGMANTRNCQLPAIVIDVDNKPEIAYVNVTTSTLAAAIGDANDAASFTVQGIIGNVPADPPSIAVDDSNNTWIAYIDDISGYIRLTKHNDGDPWSSWQTGMDYTNSNVGTSPSLAIVETDIYVFYEDDNHDIVYDKYTGTWAGEISLETGTFNSVKARWAFYSSRRRGQGYDATGSILYGHINGAGANEKLAQSFKFNKDVTVNKVILQLAKTGIVTDDLKVSIRSSLDGAILGSEATIPNSDLSGTREFITADIGSAALTANTTYYLQLERTGDRDGAKYFQWGRSGVSVFPDGAGQERDNGAWAGQTYDFAFFIFKTETEIDYLFLDETASPDVWWNKLSLVPLGPAGVKSINDLAIASVKTINDEPIAEVKTISDSA